MGNRRNQLAINNRQQGKGGALSIAYCQLSIAIKTASAFFLLFYQVLKQP